MIIESKIQSTYDLARYSAILASDQEVSFYKIGSITKGKQIRNKLNYLELYISSLDILLRMYSEGLDYNDYEMTDDRVKCMLSNVDELLYNLFS